MQTAVIRKACAQFPGSERGTTSAILRNNSGRIPWYIRIIPDNSAKIPVEFRDNSARNSGRIPGLGVGWGGGVGVNRFSGRYVIMYFLLYYVCPVISCISCNIMYFL